MGRVLGCGLLALAVALPVTGALADDDTSPTTGPTAPLTLVTLQGAGTAAGTRDADDLLARQDALLAAVGAGEPVYRWTAALNGFAAHLSEAQVSRLEAQPGIAAVETDRVRPMAGRTSLAAVQGAPSSPRLRGGAGVVVGVVDSGIAPDSPAFAEVPGLGRAPRDFAGACTEGEDWSAEDCTRKVVGARWFVAGFGADRVRSSESLSARDVLGHGTQVSSVAAGNAGVSVRVDGRDAGQFGGVAPQARIAAYKACWGAPDPSDDGCSTADVVSAVDAAVADGVDVINLALAGGEGIDTLQRALLGAAEADIVVVGAAGDAAGSAYAAHAGPWVSTIGAAVGRMSRGRVALPGGRSWTGGGRPVAVSGRAVLAQDAPAPGVSRRAAGQCRRGSLDSRVVAGSLVVCRRGGIGRIDKSEAVAQAGGRAMVLVNLGPGAVSADFHSVPTVHLTAGAGASSAGGWPRTPGRRCGCHGSRVTPAPVVRLRGARRATPGEPRSSPMPWPTVMRCSAPCPRRAAAAGACSAAAPPGLGARERSRRLLLAEHDWSAAIVRILLVTSATPVRGSSVLTQGSGAPPGPRPDRPPGPRRAHPS